MDSQENLVFTKSLRKGGGALLGWLCQLCLFYCNILIISNEK